MILFIHIASSIIGITGAYLSGIALLRQVKNGDIVRSCTVIRVGVFLVALGLTGVVVSGIGLFFENPQKFLRSGEFLSNMTVLLVLVAAAIIFWRTRAPKKIVLGQTISLFSWTWIFVVALLEPALSYADLVAGYAALLFLCMYAMRRVFVPR